MRTGGEKKKKNSCRGKMAGFEAIVGEPDGDGIVSLGASGKDLGVIIAERTQ